MAAEFEQTKLARFLLDHGSDAEWFPVSQMETVRTVSFTRLTIIGHEIQRLSWAS